MTRGAAWPDGYAHEHHAEIDSTNAEAARLAAAAGEEGPVWISAGRQTEGRGRRGRTWVSPPGNLAATLLLRPGKPVADCAQLSFVAAIAVADALASFAPTTDIRLKWPNDVLASGCKIAGILLESSSAGAGAPVWVAVGIGINLVHFPPDTEFPATALAVLGVAPPEPAAALTALAAAFARWYDVWCKEGFAPVRDAWLSRASGLGQRIRARLHGEEACGVFEGIDGTGALILRDARGTRLIAAGDVFFSG